MTVARAVPVDPGGHWLDVDLDVISTGTAGGVRTGPNATGTRRKRWYTLAK